MKNILLAMFLLAAGYAQLGQMKYGQIDPQKQEDNDPLKPAAQTIPVPAVVLEGPIDPNSYILGPGDKLGIDIVSAKNMLLTVAVTPTGDLLVPTVGIIDVKGQSLKVAVTGITKRIRDVYKNSNVNVTLIDLRKFKTSVLGAVNEPGIYEMTPVTRLWEALNLAGGLQPFANEEEVVIQSRNGTETRISVKDFLTTGDRRLNPYILEGDRVMVPYKAAQGKQSPKFITSIESVVWVTGFVRFPGTYRYIPGYSAVDYLNLAGGAMESGSETTAYVERNSKKTRLKQVDYVLPNDKIFVPKNLRYRAFGGANFMQVITALASVYLTYIAANK